MNQDTFMTLTETARFLRISKPTLLKLKRDGKLPFYSSGKKFLFLQVEILAAIKNKQL